ncbi:hypothetical protein EV131_13619, partial [Rhizobium laguerreae]
PVALRVGGKVHMAQFSMEIMHLTGSVLRGNQQTSALSRWFVDRVQSNGGRLKKAAIVALARKLLIALWKFVTAGVVIEGAVMKTA